MNRFHDARKAKQQHYLTDPRYCQEGEFKNDMDWMLVLYVSIFVLSCWGLLELAFKYFTTNKTSKQWQQSTK